MTREERTLVLDWTLPVLLMIAMTVPFWISDLDVRVARRFYVPGEGWPVGAQPLWKFLKSYGVVPAWILATGALGVWIATFVKPRLRHLRRAAMYLVFVMVIGPGVLVNDVFKENWGRPRPRDLVEFGGARDYVAPLVKSPREHGGSFASGHAATGFYLIAPYFLLRRRRPGPALAVLAAGLAYGGLVGCARMLQGAHFLSDIVWALGIVYFTAVALFYLLRLQGVGEPGENLDTLPPGAVENVHNKR